MTYTCACCHGTFISDWSDEEADQEYQAFWAKRLKDKPDKARATLCEVCYQAMMKWLAEKEARGEL